MLEVMLIALKACVCMLCMCVFTKVVAASKTQN